MAAPRTPHVSVILPTFNRATFLAEAFASIERQQWTDWELVVVDDGSTDATRAVLAELVPMISNPVRVIEQVNRGAYAARNTGLQHAQGRHVAFFDSDDLWLPHHLAHCVDALDRHEDVDWVFASCRMIEGSSGRELQPSTFYVNGRPRPFLGLRTERDGDLQIIRDGDALRCQIEHGLYCGLQNSVIRRRVFDTRRFWEGSRVVEDELFVIRLLADGGRFAYFDDPHVLYRVHGDNSSGSGAAASPEKSRAIFHEMVAGLESIQSDLTFDRAAARALRRRLATERFWGLGYNGYWRAGDTTSALLHYRKSLREWPWSPSMWKTFVLAQLRQGRLPQP